MSIPFNTRSSTRWIWRCFCAALCSTVCWVSIPSQAQNLPASEPNTTNAPPANAAAAPTRVILAQASQAPAPAAPVTVNAPANNAATPQALPLNDTDKDGLPEPEVTIRQRGQTTVHEYRIHGKLYMVKVVPVHGKAYFLIDERGDGIMRRIESMDAGLSVPMWVVKQF
jgi:hypothetical protein